ncbi:MAG: GGDEF domain-containing protein [Nitrososphaerota archaeon]|nr:GGDEF domain-containing protein [Nitrososphaerota archaeon]
MPSLSSKREQIRVIDTCAFEMLTKNSSDWIIIVDNSTFEWLYSNQHAETVLTETSFELPIRKWVIIQIHRKEQIRDHEKDFTVNGIAQSFLVTMFPITWIRYEATLVIFTDISKTKEKQCLFEDVAYKDQLTKVYSRHFGMLTIDRCIRNDSYFVLCFIDVDNLKFVNDTYGHLFGDKYIIKVVETLKTFSDTAVVSRIGGDEFLIIDCNNSYTFAKEKLQHLLANLNNYSDQDAQNLIFDFSYGIVERNYGDNYSVSELLSFADKEMYSHKNKKANRV